MFKDLLTNKTKLTYLIIAVVLVIAVMTGTIFIIKAVNNNSNKTTTTTTITQKAQADSNKAQAITAIKANDINKAKTLLMEANQQYKAAGDTSNTVDTGAQLCILGEKDYCPSTVK